ncbi:MAG: phosphotransferase [Actinomycetota bacterium]|nr:phosphotransferase [Actinomycetota bacterium]
MFETVEPEAIAEALDAFSRAHLGAAVSCYKFFATSVGSVHGVLLEDGRRVVIKVARADTDRDHLLAVQGVQAHLVAAGFPSPRPLVAPTPLAHGVAVVESLLDDGSWGNAHDPAVRGEMASALAKLIELCRPRAQLEGLRTTREGAKRLWREPHDRRFDFPGTAHGAEWIDRLARAASEQLDGLALGPAVVGHCDYRTEHLRFSDGRVSAVYDWDSLCAGPEPVIVGQAAHAFTADWSRDGWHLPTLDESFAFISDYETARGAPFTREERQGASAAMIAAVSYSARCEHSDRLTKLGTRPAGPAPPTVPPNGYLGRLATHGPQLLGIDERTPPIADR